MGDNIYIQRLTCRGLHVRSHCLFRLDDNKSAASCQQA